MHMYRGRSGFSYEREELDWFWVQMDWKDVEVIVVLGRIGM